MNGDVPKIFITNRELARRCGVPLHALLHSLKREGIETEAIFRDDDTPERYCYPCWDESRVTEIAEKCFGRLPVKELLEESMRVTKRTSKRSPEWWRQNFPDL